MVDGNFYLNAYFKYKRILSNIQWFHHNVTGAMFNRSRWHGMSIRSCVCTFRFLSGEKRIHYLRSSKARVRFYWWTFSLHAEWDEEWEMVTTDVEGVQREYWL